MFHYSRQPMVALREGYEEITIERCKINWLWGLMTAKAKKPAQITCSNSNP